MMNNELQWIAGQLERAAAPEDVFGELHCQAGEEMHGLKRLYQQLAKVTHPDAYLSLEDKRMAQLAFVRLTDWLALAEQKVKDGSYGKRAGSSGPGRISIQSKKRTYLLDGMYTEGLLYNRYPCLFDENTRTMQAVINVVRDPRNNDLAENEARVLQGLLSGKESKKFSVYLPNLIDSFLYIQDGASHRANVFLWPVDWYSLGEVHQVYPAGIDPKDMAWIFRRLLTALGFAHINDVIHGAVLPNSVWILPEQHGLMLTDWSFAVRDANGTGAAIPAVDLSFSAWYPEDVHSKDVPMPGVDLHMAARCMVYLMGGDPVRLTMPSSVPKSIQLFLKGCALRRQKACPQDAWALLAEFDDLLGRLWGERKFHPFSMKHPAPKGG